MTDQYGAGANILSGQGRNISSADELTASAQDLPERLLTQLQLEKMESRRFEEQLHQYLAEDTEPLGDLVGFPLYLPQSLISTPTLAGPLIKSPMSSVQVDGSEARLELSMDDRSPALSDRLRHLQRLLRANKEGEVASELHLSALMDMVDIWAELKHRFGWPGNSFEAVLDVETSRVLL